MTKLVLIILTMIVAADTFGIGSGVVDCDDHCRAVFLCVASTMVLFGTSPNSVNTTAVRSKKPQPLQGLGPHVNSLRRPIFACCSEKAKKILWTLTQRQGTSIFHY